MPSGGVPGAGVVVGHQVPEIKVSVHGFEVELLIVLGPGGAGDGKEHLMAVRATSKLLGGVSSTVDLSPVKHVQCGLF